MPEPQPRLLVFIPTYEERENVSSMIQRLSALNLEADLLFVDDASPDGTGEILDAEAKRNPRIHVVHREGKQGIGTAHKTGIAWAYAHGYERLVTMDCDFSHTPEDIPRLLAKADEHAVVVGSRYLRKGSLPGWKLHRRLLTHAGHLVTRGLMGIPHDATTAFRVYDLTRIPSWVFESVKSPGYSFFLESMFRFARGGYSIFELDIVLPARTYGHSKMRVTDVAKSVLRIQSLFLETLLDPPGAASVTPTEDPPQEWDAYWNNKQDTSGRLYDVIATAYRNLVIKRRLNHFIFRHFPPGSTLLHAGCGSGQVDTDISPVMEVVALDISSEALRLYRKHNPNVTTVHHASFLDLPCEDASLDGAYNLGVVEHLTQDEIERMLAQFHRALRARGKVVIFWPHYRSPSVYVLGAAHWVLNDVASLNVRLHPAEISLLRSKQEAERLFERAGFELVDYYYGARDLFIQAVFVLQKR